MNSQDRGGIDLVEVLLPRRVMGPTGRVGRIFFGSLAVALIGLMVFIPALVFGELGNDVGSVGLAICGIGVLGAFGALAYDMPDMG